MDVQKLIDAGFSKALSDEEWEAMQESQKQRYLRPGGTDVQQQIPGGNVAINYVLDRGDVRISTQQNTQDQAPYGIKTTVHYPEVAILENTKDGRRVTCDANDADLILKLSDEISGPPAPSGR